MNIQFLARLTMRNNGSFFFKLNANDFRIFTIRNLIAFLEENSFVYREKFKSEKISNFTLNDKKIFSICQKQKADHVYARKFPANRLLAEQIDKRAFSQTI